MACFPGDCVVRSGGAPGADTIAAEIADELGLEKDIKSADWDRLGMVAGLARNGQVVDVDEVVAFLDGSSSGSMDAIQKANARGIPVTIYGATGRRVTVDGSVQTSMDLPSGVP